MISAVGGLWGAHIFADEGRFDFSTRWPRALERMMNQARSKSIEIALRRRAIHRHLGRALPYMARSQSGAEPAAFGRDGMDRVEEFETFDDGQRLTIDDRVRAAETAVLFSGRAKYM